MIVACPSCGSRFKVDAERLGEKGRKVKCSSCGHIWLQRPEEPAEREVEPPALQPAALEPEPMPTPIPAAARPVERQDEGEGGSRLAWLIGALAAVAAVGAIAFVILGRAVVMDVWPGSRTFYTNIGLYEAVPGEDLEFVEVSSREEVGPDGVRTLTVAGEIANTGNQPRVVPPITASIMGEDGVLQSWQFQPDDNLLRAGERLSFSSSLRDPTPGGMRLALSFAGNED